MRVFDPFENPALLVIAYDKVANFQSFLYGPLFNRYVVNRRIVYLLRPYRKRPFSYLDSLMGYHTPCYAHGKNTVKKKNTACHQNNLSRYSIRAKCIEC